LGNEIDAGVDESRNLCCPSGSPNCTFAAEQVLAFVEVTELPVNDTAQIGEAGTNEAFPISEGGFFTADTDSDGFEDSLDGNWAFALGPADSPVKIIVMATPGDETGREFDLKLEASIEVKRLTFGLATAENLTGGEIYELLEYGPSVDAGNALLVDPEPFATVGEDFTLYLSLPGKLPSDSASSDLTLIHVPDPTEPNRILLGRLRVPDSQKNTAPTPTFRGASEIATPVIEEPGGDSFDIGQAFLSGNTAITVDSDGDSIPNDTENCVFFPNTDQSDQGGINTSMADGYGDACQCGDLEDDPASPGMVTASDVMAGAAIVAAAAEEPALHAEARSLCNVFGHSTGFDDPTNCNIKDLVVLQQATSGGGDLSSVICLRATSTVTGN
jgi:hypothetical protein